MTSIRTLAELLRDRSRWPKDFEWDYTDASRCAIGLAHRHLDKPYPAPFEDFYSDLDFYSDADSLIFFRVHTLNNCQYDQVTPEMVAQAIEDYLAKEHAS